MPKIVQHYRSPGREMYAKHYASKISCVTTRASITAFSSEIVQKKNETTLFLRRATDPINRMALCPFFGNWRKVEMYAMHYATKIPSAVTSRRRFRLLPDVFAGDRKEKVISKH